MSREQQSQNAQQDTLDENSPEQEAAHNLPPALHARAMRLGPSDDDALRALLHEWPAYSQGILEVAAQQMGNVAVIRALDPPKQGADDAGESSKPQVKPRIAHADLHKFIEDPSDHPKAQAGDAATGDAAITSTVVGDGETSGGTTTGTTTTKPPAPVEPTWFAGAKKYNLAHHGYVEQFNKATENKFVVGEGQLDLQGIWDWQGQHGLVHDGKVGPHTASMAKTLKAKTEHGGHDDTGGTGGAGDTGGSGGTHEDPKPKPKTEDPKPKPEDNTPGALARKIFPNGTGTADQAFLLLVSPDDAKLDANLAQYGDVTAQRLLLDHVILESKDAVRVQRAFHAYWHVQVSSAAAVAATAHGGDNGAASPAVAARDWPIPTLQAIHHQLKLIPDQDTRSGVWNKLSLTNDPALINRAAYGGGDFLVGSNASTTYASQGGYSVRLTADAAKGATHLEVAEGKRFKVGDQLVLDRHGKRRDLVAITGIKDNTYTIGAALKFAHSIDEDLQPDDGTGLRQINWLDATVRHEIAHSLDGGGCDTTGFYAKGDWKLGEGDAGFDDWVTAMGGDSAWATNDKTVISQTDRDKIKAAIVNTVNTRQKSLFKPYASDPHHPVTVNANKHVPVMVAAQTCFAKGDNFWTEPSELHAANGMRFSISWWYKRFQRHNETVVSDRVSEYQLYAPTEFFAEAYTMFYEEAGKSGVTEKDYGNLIRNSDWREWLREHVHNRGHAPAGTGAAKAPDGAQAQDAESGAMAGGASRGRASGNPGM